ncbi:MAG: hypothetical protein C0464_02245 [Cyanobacteria bacterium DS2.008]|nr:hypothetical protein [Cyanobacteria bacterium DS2.008]
MQWTRLLVDNQILGVMSNDGRGLFRGCYWGSVTRHGVIDIDQGSKYHNSQELAELNYKFAAVGLTLVPFQSSSSGGWHLYYFLDDWASSREIGNTIKAWLLAHGYEIKSGTLEVFPSGNALRLPLQQGFAWLGHDGRVIRTREQLTQNEAISSFLINFENNVSNWQEAKALIDSQLELTKSVAGRSAQEHREAVTVDGLGDLFAKGLDHEKYQRGRQYWLNGLSGRNQRHDAVICLGHWLWYGDRSLGIERLPGLRNAGIRAEMIRAWLLEKHNGHSKAVNLGRQGEIEGQILRACQWASQSPTVSVYEPYPLTIRLLKRLEWLYQKTGKLWTVEELAKANADRCLDARKRIEEAVSLCLETGCQISRNGLAEIARCSPNTISKHRDLWCFLGTGSCVSTNGGFGGVLAPPLLASSSENGFDRLALVVLDSVIVPSGLACGLTELIDCSIGTDSTFRRPVSEAPFLGAGFEKERVEITALSLVELSSDLAVVGSLNFPVAPLFQAWRTSQPESPQSQAQALRVLSASLTLGPKLPGFQALRHGTAGGILLSSGAGLVGESVDFSEFRTVGHEVVEESGVVSDSQSPVLQFFGCGKVAQVFSKDGKGGEIQPGRRNFHDSRSIAGKKSPSHCRGP